MKPLVLLKTLVRTAGILAGAFLVFTGLANLPRMWTLESIAPILTRAAGSESGVVLP